MNYQNYQNLILLTSSDAKQTQMLIFFFTNSAQRELVSIWTQLQLIFLALKPCIWRGLNIYFLFTFSLFYIQSEYSNHNLHLTPTRILLKGADSFDVLYSQLKPFGVCMFTVQLALAAKNSAQYLKWTWDYSGKKTGGRKSTAVTILWRQLTVHFGFWKI